MDEQASGRTHAPGRAQTPGAQRAGTGQPGARGWEGVEIREAGLVLRPWRPGDADAVFRACQDPDIQRWTSIPRPYLREHAEEYVTGFTRRTWESGTAAPMGAFAAATGEMLGAIGLGQLRRGSDAEIGYWVAPWARGARVAINGVRAVARWSFDTLALRRLDWRAEIGNHASRLVAETVGFRVEGIQRGGVLRPDGHAADCWRAGLLPGELREAGTAVHPLTHRRAVTFGHAQPRLCGRTTSGHTLWLRPPHAGDLDAIVASCQDPESQRWTTVPRPYVRGDAEYFVHEVAPRRWARGDGAVFALADEADAFVGSMELRLGPTPDTADVGYLVAPWARGQGYAPAALRLLAAWGIAELGVNRVEWRAYVGNNASRRVAEKAGFTVEGIARDGCLHHGGYRDGWTGALLAADLLPDGAGANSADGDGRDEDSREQRGTA